MARTVAVTPAATTPPSAFSVTSGYSAPHTAITWCGILHFASEALGACMKRRAFIKVIGGAAVAWPHSVPAQQGERVRRIGVLMGYAENDPEAQAWIRVLLQGLKEHGWIDGSTVRFDYRWATDNLKPMGSYAADLMALSPDLVVAAATPALAAVWRETRSVPIVFVNVADPIG